MTTHVFSLVSDLGLHFVSQLIIKKLLDFKSQELQYSLVYFLQPLRNNKITFLIRMRASNRLINWSRDLTTSFSLVTFPNAI